MQEKSLQVTDSETIPAGCPDDMLGKSACFLAAVCSSRERYQEITDKILNGDVGCHKLQTPVPLRSQWMPGHGTRPSVARKTRLPYVHQHFERIRTCPILV